MKLPNTVSDATRRRNPALFGFPLGSTGQVTVLERNSSDGTRATPAVKETVSTKFLVCVESVRKRLCDSDNLCAKYVIDCCRFAGVLPDDSPDQTQIQISQRKAVKGETERTIVEIYQITP